jgi:hypothetical protein
MGRGLEPQTISFNARGERFQLALFAPNPVDCCAAQRMIRKSV